MACHYPIHAFKARSKDAEKMRIVFKPQESIRGERLDLPCGRCTGCRLERSRQWATRCMHEASLYDENSFLTLTYSDENLPKDGSLVVSDYQDFMKRLRKKVYPKKIRYYHCGEYGEKFNRPHYHSLLFGHQFSDLKLFSNKGQFPVFTSEELDGIWQKGHAIVGDVTFESAAYVARYVMKKITGEKAEQHYAGRKPEYTTMSRRPGIGKGWYEKFKTDIYPRDGVIVRGHKSRVPRFYDNLLADEDPLMLEKLKDIRRLNRFRTVEDVLSNGKLARVSDNDSFRNPVKDAVLIAKVGQLKRPYEGDN